MKRVTKLFSVFLSLILIGAFFVRGESLTPTATQHIFPDVSAYFSSAAGGPFENIAAGAEQFGSFSTVRHDYVPYALPDINLMTLSTTENSSNFYYQPLVFDMNGDGLMDFVYSNITGRNNYGSGGYPSEQFVLLGTGSGYELVYYCQRKYQGGVLGYVGHCSSLSTAGAANPNGLLESFQAVTKTSPVSGTLSRSAVPYALPNIRFRSFTSVGGVEFVTANQMDINGDGLQDFIYSSSNNSSPVIQYVLLNMREGFKLVYYCQLDGNGTYRGDCADDGSAIAADPRTVTPMADLNSYQSSFSYPRSSTFVNTPPPYALPNINLHSIDTKGYNIWEPVPRQIDVNGDGMSDIVYAFPGANQYPRLHYVLLNKGNGFRMGYYCRRNYEYQGDCASSL